MAEKSASAKTTKASLIKKPKKATRTVKKTASAKSGTSKTNNKLVIVESPAKANTIAKFLGRGFKVVASNGHIRDLPKSKLGVDTDNNFEPYYITVRGKADVLKKIRTEAKDAKFIYLATDPDREGEAISWHIAQLLNLDDQKACRIVFNEITSSAVKNAIEHVRPIDMDLVNAQQTRRILDRLVGYKISPLLWQKVSKGLSAGRVQSVAVRMICDREDEIDAFISQEYWTLHAQVSKGEKRKPFAAKLYAKDGKKLDMLALGSEQMVDEVIKDVQKEAFTVSDVKISPMTRKAPPPFTTSQLQQEASRRLGFTAKRTMMTAQHLYEGVNIPGMGTFGLVTYIRTDSMRVAQEAQTQARAFIAEQFGKQYVPEKPNIYTSRKSAQDAHEAIRPTNASLLPDQIKDTLTADQYKLYKLIYTRFIASQMAPSKQEKTVISINAGPYTFRAEGIRILFDGYLKVYGTHKDDEDTDSETARVLPEVKAGEILSLLGLKKEQHFTQPPPRYTEASLVKALEENSIGRPSTYAPIISTIMDRGYIAREKKALYPTELGRVVTQLLKEHFEDIVDIEFTAGLEEQLDQIAEGDKQWQAVLSEFFGPFEKTLEKANVSAERVKIADEVSDVPCDKCGTMMVYKMGKFGRFLACPRYPECRNTKAIVETVDTPCPKCGAKLIKRRSRKGRRIFYGCEKYPECDFVSWDLPVKEKCPVCGSYMVQRGSKGKEMLLCANSECGHKQQKSAVKNGTGS